MTKRFLILMSLLVGLLSNLSASDIEIIGEHKDSIDRVLFIPSAFTPNNDGINDIFKIVNLEQEQIVYFKIFNKWGTVIYESADNNAYWDGTYKGKLQESGDYGYSISIRFPESEKVVLYKGIISLINQ